MKTVFALLAIGLLLTGCGKATYVTHDGVVIQTSDDMAVIMATRDSNIEKTRSFNEQVVKASTPEQVVALTAVHFGNVGQRIERGRTWDERLLPWVQVLTPYFLSANKSGRSTVAVDGTGNTVVFSEDKVDNESSKSVTTSPMVTQSTQTQVQTGETGAMNPASAYSPNIPLTDPGVVPVTGTDPVTVTED
ncbi:MAG TPA: hypothetical protein DCS09_08495 [Porphyromonadaceae bacterium]|nr:hypothetical protein [Porphyromonadaceae bacterium]